MESRSELESEVISPGTVERIFAWRDHHQALVVVASVVGTVASLGAVPPLSILWLGLGLAALFWIAFGALEPALVVVVSAGAGMAWGQRVYAFGGYRIEDGFFIGSLLAAMLVQRRLSLFRGLPARADTVIAAASFFAAVLFACVLCARHDPAWPLVALPVLSAVLLAPIGMNILLQHGKGSGSPRLRHLLGGAWVFAFLAAVQVVLLCVIGPFLRLCGMLCGISEERRLARMRALSRFGTQRLFAWFPYGRLELIGVSAESFRKPSIVVSNHQSSVDIPLVLSLPGDVRLTLKKRVWDAPYLGIAARRLRHVLVEPEQPAATLERCRAALAEGASVHFFPEGTRGHDLYPRRFHRGAFDVAVQLGCDVVPVVLCDTRMCVPRDAHWVEDFHMVVKVLAPITPQDAEHAAGARELMKHAQERIRAELTRELERINTPAYLACKVRRHYRYLGRSFERRVERELASEELRSFLDAELPEEGTLLDLFCGVGVRANWLREKRPRLRVHGLDPDAAAIRIARASAAGTERLTFSIAEASGEPGGWQLPRADGAIVPARDRAIVAALLPRLTESLPAGARLFLLDATPEARELCTGAGFLA